MKNLLVYTNPLKSFDKETTILVKVQIDNSLDLGWKKENILLVTNFDYEYKGVKALVIGDIYCNSDKTSNKVPVVKYLLNQDLLNKKELYWYHDFDVYQNNVIEEFELGLDNVDFGLVPYGYKKQWQCGSFFFRTGAKDIFNLWDSKLSKRKRSRTDEKVLIKLTDNNRINSDKYKILNVTYNFTMRYIRSNYIKATKPLKVLHFHPWYIDELLSDTTLNIFMYGKNRLKKPLMSKRLIKIFNEHNIV